jgi:glutamate racemase
VNDAPIGIFDSGVGGLTVARSILDQLPHESTVYIGDTLNTPYGTKPLAAVRAHALEVMDDLVDAGVKLLVIACNTASSAMLRDARERYTLRRGIPVVEVILPAARRAVAATRSGRIGVIATTSTVESRSYDDAFAVAPGVTLLTQACPQFVPFV